MIDTTRLRVLRTDRGYSQRFLAEAAGVDSATFRRLEDGADPGDLPVIDRIATALGTPPSTLFVPRPKDAAAETTDDNSSSRGRAGLRRRVGGIVLASPGISITALATLLDTLVEVIEAALPTVAEHLRAIGLAIARHGERLRIEPLDVPSVDANIVVGDRPMTVTEARLLRRVDRGEDVRRSLSKAGRELTLPSLCRSGLVDTTLAVPAHARNFVANRRGEPDPLRLRRLTVTSSGGRGAGSGRSDNTWVKWDARLLLTAARLNARRRPNRQAAPIDALLALLGGRSTDGRGSLRSAGG